MQSLQLARATPRRIAVYAADGIGDALIGMLLVQNLKQAGHDVAFYSSPMVELAALFPGVDIRPFPDPTALQTSLYEYDLIVAADYSSVAVHEDTHANVVVLKESLLNLNSHMVANYTRACKKLLGLENPSSETGWVVPTGWKYRCREQRLVIHPTSKEKSKNWRPIQYRRLARRLNREGWDIAFIVSQRELADWAWGHRAGYAVPRFDSLLELARYIYESAFFIGNDSGPGHIASMMHVPTLSLFARHVRAAQWRPGWGPGALSVPPGPFTWVCIWDHLWSFMLTPANVKADFDRLVRRYPGST